LLTDGVLAPVTTTICKGVAVAATGTPVRIENCDNAAAAVLTSRVGNCAIAGAFAVLAMDATSGTTIGGVCVKDNVDLLPLSLDFFFAGGGIVKDGGDQK
jgi:hypothetical protein